MQLLTYVVSTSLSCNHVNRLCQLYKHVHVRGQHMQFRVSTSLVCKAMTVVFGLGTRLHVTIKQCCEQVFDHSKFVKLRAMLSISFMLKSR